MLPMLRQLHDADGDIARADVLLRMPDSILLKYHGVILESCRRARFEAGQQFVDLRTALMLAVRDSQGLPPADLADLAERMRAGLAAFAGGQHG
ncbi:hypothetical protein [Mesorhizobium sp. B2-1-3A]|uniref:hypothetical protein n=1 Tax=Mesorhizobium sp. B2-1-3A TaxID=2589971 RepID=UPI001128DD9B|nr:hypothetical protein [Mesorhizobium sp. B2-1-3A]TPM92709.1 hypothetical protein FJ977_27895 [Mesorhizobium sp. B2-1-3A]